jgi:6-phosphogluconolactonase
MAAASAQATLRRHDFETPALLAAALAGAVAAQLREGIAARGAAVLAVSGGRTPERFFAALAQQNLDWAKVTVTLVDDRWVPLDSPRSNEALLRRCLLQGPASAARLAGLVGGETTPEAGLETVAGRIAALPRPFDAVVLGMGADGHTASFFPGGDRLAEATDPAGRALVLPMQAPGAGEPRITLTLPLIIEARAAYLHIEGQDKAEVLAAAQQEGPPAEMPVRAVLRNRSAGLDVYWCP